MAPIPALFTVPIESKGSIVCTHPSQKVYLLTFQSPPDNRLTPAFCASFVLALDIIEYRFPKGVVITTSGIAKFYSNGLNYESAVKTKGFFGDILYPLWRRILTFPMPTIALINGHAFAGGLMTAMMHDYRIFNPHRGFLCLNELDFGAPMGPPMSSIFRQKIPSPSTYRNMILESKRYSALEAIEEGIVDGLGGAEEALAFVAEMKLVKKAESSVYGVLKTEMWRETVWYLENADAAARKHERDEAEGKKRAQEAEKRIVAWESGGRNGQAKL
ncbi:enoyl-hydratase isomerase [Lasallia pustulata]|uniref:Enoyl-hydratase isomerase n=1 Tax=Lasallia pustulata TaxID=136370 RepID=A0A1W5CTF9_9LECA|nr:enoyl-hydratase isomerase [Lasallia pustulata]